MRRAVAIVVAVMLAIGAGALIGAKRLDEIAAARPFLALSSGAETYFIPTSLVRSSGLRVQLMRLAGCWDARDGAYLAATGSFVDCRVKSVVLTVPTSVLDPSVREGFYKPELGVRFWPVYSPPVLEIGDLAEAMRGERDWASRQVTLRADWKLWRVESAASPWVFLLLDEPKSGELAELTRLYAGRCYRAERIGDAGMTCNFALRTGTSAAIEFSLGADEMMSFPAWRDALQARAAEWRRAPAMALR